MDTFLNALICATVLVLALVFVSFYVVVVKGHPFFSEKTVVNAARLARALTGIVFAPLASWWAVYFIAYFVLFISENF